MVCNLNNLSLDPNIVYNTAGAGHIWPSDPSRQNNCRQHLWQEFFCAACEAPLRPPAVVEKADAACVQVIVILNKVVKVRC